MRFLAFVLACVLASAPAVAREPEFQRRAHVDVCNKTASKEKLYAAVMVASLTWGGYRAGAVYGWTEIKPGRCENVFWSTHPGETVYVYVDGENGGVWRSSPRSGTASSFMGEPNNGYWCVTDDAANKWPNNKDHPIKAPTTCPAGSRLVYGGSVSVYEGDTFTLNIK